MYLLVDRPGILGACGPELWDKATNFGARTDQVLGVDWESLVLLGRSGGSAASLVGRLRATQMRVGCGQPGSLLLHVEPGASTVRPPPAPQQLPYHLVRGRDAACAHSLLLAERLFRLGLPVFISGPPGAGAAAVAFHLATMGNRPRLLQRVGPGRPVPSRLPDTRPLVVLIDDLHLIEPCERGRLAQLLDDGSLGGTSVVAHGWPRVVGGAARAELPRDIMSTFHAGTITLPALSARRDVQYLVECILAEGGARHQLSPRALRIVAAHSWPENLAQLRSVLHQLQSTKPAGLIHERDLALDSGLATEQPSDTSRSNAQRSATLEALERTKGNVAAAARLLGVARSTIYRAQRRG